MVNTYEGTGSYEGERITVEKFEELLPPLSYSDNVPPLADYISQIRREIRQGSLQLDEPLVSRNDPQAYFDMIGPENPYLRRLTRLHVLATNELASNRELPPELLRSGMDQLYLYRRDRLKEFQALRRSIVLDLSAMWSEPMKADSASFRQLGRKLEGMRSLSPEMHLHCSNLLVKAWDRIPHMVREKECKPNCPELAARIRAMAEESRVRDEAREHAREIARGKGLGPGRSM